MKCLKIINNYGWLWLSFRFERARKRDCICLLGGDGKTLKEVNGLEWIIRDSYYYYYYYYYYFVC